MEEYLILPGCDDTNRGDQALIWETVEMAKAAGYNGKYYMLAPIEKSKQSKERGINSVKHILKHPSEHFSGENNIKYSFALKIKWAFAAVLDLIYSLPLLSPMLRRLILPIYNDEVKDTLVHYQNANTSFVKGGGFLHAYGGFSETYKIFYFLFHINLALSYGHTVYVMPNSFGPFNGPFVKQMINSTLKRCKLVMTREEISSKALNDINIKSVTMPDLAFYLKCDKQFNAKNALIDVGIPVTNECCVGITVRPYRFPGSVNADTLYNNYIESMAKFVYWLSQHGYFPVLIEHVSSVLDHENDMIAIKAVREKIEKMNLKCNYGVFSDPNLTCSQMKCIYSEMMCTVGTRFHSVIFSLSENVPSIALAYGGNKGKGIMTDLGLGDYVIAIESISEDTLEEKFNLLVQHYNEYKLLLKDEKSNMEKMREQIVRKIYK